MHRSEVLAIPTTMHWLRQSMAYTRLKLFVTAAPGKIWTKWNTQPWIGLTGLIIDAFWNRLEIFHRLNTS